MVSWFQKWFNTEYYHILYKNRNEEEAKLFISKLLQYLNLNKEALFCDLACGKGRHAMQINLAGYTTMGLDLSKNSIIEATKLESKTLQFYIHDMREPFGSNRFDVITNLFTSFGYFESLKTNLQVLKHIHAALKPNGLAIIDFINVDAFLHCFPMSEQKNIDGIHFNIQKYVENDIIIKKIEVIDNDKKQTFEERLQAITYSTFNALATKSGFNIKDTFGTYNLGLYNTQSPRLILVLNKKQH